MSDINANYYITKAGSIIDGWTIAIYIYVGSNSKNHLFPITKMTIINDFQNNLHTAMLLRDVNLSFTIEHNKIFNVGVVAYNPKYVSLVELQNEYLKNASINNNDYVRNIGIYTIRFNENDFVNDTNKCIYEVVSQYNNNMLKFNFTFNKLNDKEYVEAYGNKTYIVSHPSITFSLDNIHF